MAEDQFEAGPDWAEKTDFAPGVLLEAPASVLRYQALLGNVYTLETWEDGSTARGEVPLAHLEALSGAPVREGWYDAAGKYLGPTLDAELVEDRVPTL